MARRVDLKFTTKFYFYSAILITVYDATQNPRTDVAYVPFQVGHIYQLARTRIAGEKLYESDTLSNCFLFSPFTLFKVHETS